MWPEVAPPERGGSFDVLAPDRAGPTPWAAGESEELQDSRQPDDESAALAQPRGLVSFGAPPCGVKIDQQAVERFHAALVEAKLAGIIGRTRQGRKAPQP